MARIFFMAFDDAGQYPLIKQFRNAGHKLVVAQPKYPEFADLLRQQVKAPELFVVDCSKLPSHARESANYIRGLKTYKTTPFILYNVKPEDEAKAREKVPGAVILRNDDLAPAVEAALGSAGSAGPGPKP